MRIFIYSCIFFIGCSVPQPTAPTIVDDNSSVQDINCTHTLSTSLSNKKKVHATHVTTTLVRKRTVSKPKIASISKKKTRYPKHHPVKKYLSKKHQKTTHKKPKKRSKKKHITVVPKIITVKVKTPKASPIIFKKPTLFTPKKSLLNYDDNRQLYYDSKKHTDVLQNTLNISPKNSYKIDSILDIIHSHTVKISTTIYLLLDKNIPIKDIKLLTQLHAKKIFIITPFNQDYYALIKNTPLNLLKTSILFIDTTEYALLNGCKDEVTLTGVLKQNCPIQECKTKTLGNKALVF